MSHCHVCDNTLKVKLLNIRSIKVVKKRDLNSNTQYSLQSGTICFSISDQESKIDAVSQFTEAHQGLNAFRPGEKNISVILAICFNERLVHLSDFLSLAKFLGCYFISTGLYY